MKNKTFISIVGALVVIGGAAGIYQLSASPASANLSEEEAMTKAQSQFPGEVIEIELERNGKNYVYEVDIEGSDRNYELSIDANTGEILKLEEDRKNTKKETGSTTKDDNSDDQNKKKDDDTDNNNVATNENKDTNDDDVDDNTTKKDNTTKNTPISAEKAKEIALAKFKGTITELELDEDDGYLLYELQLDTDKNEVELDIDAYTGEIIAISIDDLDN
ncbi:PepSY domain-containing protein [Aquibacillus saliphilus]|uniref:PepSY domain-containing protein n=1 Tax=Aquibacillus saliphilus TaxID=1909422 RepID=UPI001CEFD0FA|nr:PepSY domain-containing protein [Aquibacillus saliphilus]